MPLSASVQVAPAQAIQSKQMREDYKQEQQQQQRRKAQPQRPQMEEEELRVKRAFTVSLHGNDVQAKRKEILDYFHNTYDMYEKLYEPISEKGMMMRADPLRHPLIFYYGHTAVFFINKLRLAQVIKARINKKYESMFAIGVDEMSWDDLLPDSHDWPSVADVKAYRDEVRAVVDEAIKKTPLKLPITWEDGFWGILMGIEHERIHLETSSVLIRQLPLSVIKPMPFFNVCPVTNTEAPANQLLTVTTEPTKIRLGKDWNNDKYYGWDNEYGDYTAEIPPLKASKYLVSNAEFLEFMQDGGYTTQKYWTEEGWKWANYRSQKGKHPLFWVPQYKDEDKKGEVVGYKFRTMLEEIDMPWSWPVEVNNLEAKAFCNWKAAQLGRPVRLPQEDEYELLRRLEVPQDYPDWRNNYAPGNINLEWYCSSTPVDFFPPSEHGFHDVIGNVWQHTETPIDGYKGFRVHEWYDDFSVPTFDLQHNLLKGGSWISTGNEAVPESRYAFRRHFFQHAGIRYVETERAVTIRSDVYERNEAVATYADLHYGPTHFNVPNYPKAIAEHVIEVLKEEGIKLGRALDMGCAVGRTSFELAKAFEHVVGLDFSARFIRLAVQLQQEGRVTYATKVEGELMSDEKKTLQSLDLVEVKDKCVFFQADACNLDPRWSGYDLVLASNLIDQLYEPRLFLNTIHERINANGMLVIASTNSWDASITPRESWLGGFTVKDEKTGQVTQVSTLDGLHSILDKNFELVTEPVDVPFVLREHSRQFRHGLSEVSFWRRRQ